MNLWLLLVVCFVTVTAKAQDSTGVLIHIPAKGKAVTDFVPKGYHQLTSKKGDFNHDGKEDRVIVLEEATAHFNKHPEFSRILIILFGANGGWTLAGRSDKVMLPADMNKDPMLQVDVKGSTIDVHQISYAQGFVSNFKNLFRYQEGGFYLIHRTTDSSTIQVKCEKLNEYRSKKYEDINYETGERIRKKISYYCELLIDKKDTIDVKPIILSEVKTD